MCRCVDTHSHVSAQLVPNLGVAHWAEARTPSIQGAHKIISFFLFGGLLSLLAFLFISSFTILCCLFTSGYFAHDVRFLGIMQSLSSTGRFAHHSSFNDWLTELTELAVDAQNWLTENNFLCVLK